MGYSYTDSNSAGGYGIGGHGGYGSTSHEESGQNGDRNAF